MPAATVFLLPPASTSCFAHSAEFVHQGGARQRALESIVATADSEDAAAPEPLSSLIIQCRPPCGFELLAERSTPSVLKARPNDAEADAVIKVSVSSTSKLKDAAWFGMTRKPPTRRRREIAAAGLQPPRGAFAGGDAASSVHSFAAAPWAHTTNRCCIPHTCRAPTKCAFLARVTVTKHPVALASFGQEYRQRGHRREQELQHVSLPQSKAIPPNSSNTGRHRARMRSSGKRLASGGAGLWQACAGLRWWCGCTA